PSPHLVRLPKSTPAPDMAMPWTGTEGDRESLAGWGRAVLALPGGPPATLFEVGPKQGSEVLAPQGRVDERFDIPELVARVVAGALKLDRPHRRSLARQLAHGIGQPDLAVPTRFGPFEDLENLRLENVAVHRRELARGVFRLWLFHDREHALGALVDGRSGD